MSISHLMKDTVSLIKKDGRRFDEIKALVQRNKISIDDASIPVEEGDTYERRLPNGVLERYTVLDAGYYQKVGGINAHYQSEVRKETKIDRTPPQSHVIYNLIGPNARVNIHSVDNSANLVGVEPDELFDRLHEVIKQSIEDDDLSTQLSSKVDELQQAQGKSDFTEKYQEFMALAANHITILAPFMPALSQLLS